MKMHAGSWRRLGRIPAFVRLLTDFMHFVRTSTRQARDPDVSEIVAGILGEKFDSKQWRKRHPAALAAAAERVIEARERDAAERNRPPDDWVDPEPDPE